MLIGQPGYGQASWANLWPHHPDSRVRHDYAGEAESDSGGSRPEEWHPDEDNSHVDNGRSEAGLCDRRGYSDRDGVDQRQHTSIGLIFRQDLDSRTIAGARQGRIGAWFAKIRRGPLPWRPQYTWELLL